MSSFDETVDRWVIQEDRVAEVAREYRVVDVVRERRVVRVPRDRLRVRANGRRGAEVAQ